MQKRTKDNEDNGGRSGVVQAHNQFGYKASVMKEIVSLTPSLHKSSSAAFQVKKVDKDDPKKVLEGVGNLL